jgi:hypothetical protein
MGNKSLYGEMPSSQFGISGDYVVNKRLKFNTNGQPPNSLVELNTAPSATGDVTLTLPEESGTLALQGESSGNGFQTIQVPNGTSPVATGPNDTLTLAEGNGISISGNAGTDTVTLGLATRSPYRIIGTDSSGEVYDIPTASVSSTSGGIFQNTPVSPDGAGGDQINNLWAPISPLQNSPNASYNLHQIGVDFDPNLTGFDIGTAGQAATLINLYARHYGASDIGTLSYININSNLGDETNSPTIGAIDFLNMYQGVASGVSVVGQIRGAVFAPNMPTGTSVGNGVIGFADFSNFDITVPGWSSFISGPSVSSIANNTNFNGISVNPTIDSFEGNSGFSGVSVSPSIGTFDTGSFLGISVNPQSVASVGSATGVYVNMSNVTSANKKAMDITGDVSINGALAFSGALSIGQLNAFYSATVVDSGGPNPTSLNGLVSQITAPASSTTANGDTLGLNTAMLMVLGSNATVTSGPLDLGFSAIALPCVAETHTGSSLDHMNAAVYALNLSGSSTGGTIDNVNLCRVVAIPNGITTINKLKGFEMDMPFGNVGTSMWGVYITPECDNYMQGSLLVGGVAGSSDTAENSSCGIEIRSTTKTFLNARMTTTQRDALTALNGMQIYNTTADKLQVYAAGSWVDLH